MQNNNNDLSRYGPAQQKPRHTFVISVQTCNLGANQLHHMPITCQNELPHINIVIGTTEGHATITVLYDTGGALSSGELSYHKNIMKAYPEMVDSYEEFNSDNPFDPIKLCGAILNPEAYSKEQHDILTAVICYRLPYDIGSSNPPKLAFALGKDVAVDTILGIPSIDGLQLELRYHPTKYIFSHILQCGFPIDYKETVLHHSQKQSINTSAITNTSEASASTSTPTSHASSAPSTTLPGILQAPLNYFMPTVPNEHEKPVLPP